MAPDAHIGARLQRVLLSLSLAPASLLIWAAFAELDEVAVGEGKFVPSSKAQLIQSAEGGVVVDLRVREGDTVRSGDILALLDPAVAEASVGETSAKIAALRARKARLEAELAGADEIGFPPDLADQDDLLANERELFEVRRSSYATDIANIRHNLDLAQSELALLEPLVSSGATNKLEVLHARQKIAELQSSLDEITGRLAVEARKDMAATLAELSPLVQVEAARATQLSRTEIRSPVNGVIKDVRINTLGGVVPPGGELFEVVPSEDQLLIEARISPRDIAFIRPDQRAVIKVTAYDSSIYGTLDAHVELISPDTVVDETQKGLTYYRVFLRTDETSIVTADGRSHPIIPGMVAIAEIRTGKKTVLEYLIKPLNRASEALRER